MLEWRSPKQRGGWQTGNMREENIKHKERVKWKKGKMEEDWRRADTHRNKGNMIWKLTKETGKTCLTGAFSSLSPAHVFWHLLWVKLKIIKTQNLQRNVPGLFFKLWLVTPTKILSKSYNFICSRCKGQPEWNPRSGQGHSTTYAAKRSNRLNPSGSCTKWLFIIIIIIYTLYGIRWRWTSWELLVAADALLNATSPLPHLASSNPANSTPTT